MALTKEEELRLKAEARLRLKRKQEQAQAQPQTQEDPGVLERVGDFYRGYGNFMREGAETGLRAGQLLTEGAGRGVMELLQLPGAALNQAPRLANLIPGVDDVGPIVEDYNPAMDAARRIGLVGVTEPENRLEEYILQGGRAAGGAAVAAPALSLAMRGAQGTSMLGRAGKETAEAAARRPALFVGSDATGGAGAEAGGDAGVGVAEWLGMGETGQEVGRGLGMLLGGVTGGTAPSVGPPAAQRVKDYAQQQFAPFTDKGSRMRAGAQLQRQVADLDNDPDAPWLIERAARRAESAPEGVTPARATREPGLIAQENRIAEDIPTAGRQLRGQLDDTQRNVEASVRGMAGPETPRPAWTRNLIQRVAAPGATIDPGDTDQMFRQAYDSFKPSYREFDGFQVDASRLGRSVDRALKDPELPVGSDARKAGRAVMKSQLQGLAQRVGKDGTNVRSEDLLTLRQNLRGRIRDLQGSQGQTADETRRVLSRVEQELTKYIDDALPQEAREGLRAIDNQYRQFKALEDAAFRGGEGELNPKRVLDSIRRRASSRGGITRGDQEALRQQVIQGLSGDELLADRDLLGKAVRGLPADQRKPIHAKLLNAIADRARTSPNDEGERLLSGSVLREQIKQNREALKSAGMSDGDLGRLDKLGQVMVDVQRKSPEELQTLFTDGPNSLAELAAAVAGAKSGQKLAGGGIGASLVLAQFMSNRARRLLGDLFGEQATKLLTDASTDPKLYASLLRTRNASLPKQREAAATVEAWLLQNIGDPDGPEMPTEEREPLRYQRPGPPQR